MAINYPVRHSPGQRFLLWCVAAIVLLTAAGFIVRTPVYREAQKQPANQIVSPWDKAAIPPPMVRPSPITANPASMETHKPAPRDDSSKLGRHRGWRHHWRKSWRSH